MRIKICGLMQPADVEAVNRFHPDYAGFIVNFPQSPRSLSPEQVQQLKAHLSPDITAVCVTVNQSLPFNADLLEHGPADILQLHGQEEDDQIRALQARTGKPVWKAFRIRSERDVAEAQRSSAQLVLLDNGYGTGKPFDWTLIRGIGRPFALAGGLRADNLAQAAKMHPFLLDISSGAETDGKKDAEKIRTLIEQVRSMKHV